MNCAMKRERERGCACGGGEEMKLIMHWILTL